MERLKIGDIVQHFKREILDIENIEDKNLYLYKILAFAEHTETGELMVVYQALYDDQKDICFKIFVRPYEMFMSEVDKEKYPNVEQRYRFELYDSDAFAIKK